MSFRSNAVLTLFLVSILFYSCTPKLSDLVVSEFKGEKITVGEFEKAYAKNVGGYDNAKDDSLSKKEKFLDLYTNFKMKLADANRRGYQTNPELLDELSSYKKKVGASYILEKQIVEPGIKKFYEDRKQEIRMSHIMFAPKDESFEKAKLKAEEVMGLLKSGIAFTELARQYSDDNYTKNDGGDIYWITAGQVIPEFEKVAYSTEPGTVYPEIVKTNFGYHIIAVTAKQPAKYKVRASHILVSYNQDGKVDSAKAFEKINEIKNKLAGGADFAEVAKEYSDDKTSGVNGGDLGFFSRRMMVKEFDEQAFNLKVGEISDIVKTRFGYHLLKVTDIENFPEFEKEKDKLRDIYKKSRYENEYNEFISKLKKEFNYKQNDDIISEIVSSNDTIKFSESELNSLSYTKNKDKNLFKIQNTDFNFDSVFTYAVQEKKFQNKVINHNNNLSEALKLYADQKLLEFKSMNLDKENSEFAELMNDYKNGIYIFKLQEEEVWNKIHVDSLEMLKVYNENKNKYMLPDRVDFSEILVKDDSLALELYGELKKGAGFDSLAKSNTRRAGFRNKSGRHGLVNVANNELAVKAFALEKVGDFSEPFKTKDGWSIVKLNFKDSARVKTFDEAKAEISSEIQEKQSKLLEEQFIGKLKNEFSPVYYHDNLKNAFKSN